MKKNTDLNLFDTDFWKALPKKPLLYVGFHERNGCSYLVLSTQKELMFVKEFDSLSHARNDVIDQLQNLTSGVPVIFNQKKTGIFFKDFATT
jgi:hypothetical protein